MEEYMKNKTLVVLAAGMGSRFGGLKQIEPVGPNGEFIIDYSVYDAKKAGFNKVVFVIKKENEEVFKETIGKRIENKIEVVYAYQDVFDVPEEVNMPKTRTKPLGTAHAVYVTRNMVHESFAVISADDFYGAESFHLLADFLDHTDDFGIIGFHIGNTLTENGSVKRGVCFEKDGLLDTIVESKVEKIDGVIYGEPIDGRTNSEKYVLEENHPVSMLMFALRPSVYDYMEKDIVRFFQNQTDLSTVEYFLPTVLDDMFHEGLINIKVIPTKEKWMGITYTDDLILLKNHIHGLIEQGEYPSNLWSE